jgi:Zn-dependent peptidase ImmA (M78 family)
MSWIAGSRATRSENRLIARTVARMVERAREGVPDYAARTAPVGSHLVSAMLGHQRCFVSWKPLDEGCGGMALPAVNGVHILVVNSRGGVWQQELAVRHEISHVVAGEVSEPTYLDDDEMSWTERCADLFALADLIPRSSIREMRKGRRPWRLVLQDLHAWVGEVSEGWSLDRVHDRAQLRMVLYRERNI